jgi:RimJ/RimL family protein N-acetyltransferase
VTVVVTERLTLTTLSVIEAAAIVAGERAGRAWADDYPTEGDLVVAGIVGEAGTAYDEDATLGPMQVTVTDSGRIVGGVGFLSSPEADGSVEIGYGLAPSAQGRGYATEAVHALVALARAQGASSVVAMTEPDNAASHRVLERCGFVPDGEIESADDGPLWRWRRSG